LSSIWSKVLELENVKLTWNILKHYLPGQQNKNGKKPQ
jgi:hypothetical protein